MASKNLVSLPPFTSPMTDSKGMLTKAWSIWFRDIYTRTSFKKSNAIDDNLSEIENNKNDIDSNASDIAGNVININTNASNISNNASNISTNAASILANASDIAENTDNITAADNRILNIVIHEMQLKIADLEQMIASIAPLAEKASVVGPFKSTDNSIPKFDGITGKALQGTNVEIDDSDNVNIPSGSEFQENGVKVVAARQTGWSATTGTEIRTNFGDASLSDTSQALRALIVDLKAHGLIGA